MRRLALHVSLTALALCALASGAAHAQSLAVSAPAGARVEGPGIALGDRLVLHLGIGAEFRYDSNVFYEDSNGTQALALRLTPTFALATKNPQRTLDSEGNPAPHKIEFR